MTSSEAVIIQAIGLDDPAITSRRLVWARLLEMVCPPGFKLPLVEAHEADGVRHEVVRAPSGIPLQAWAATPEGSSASVVPLVRDLASVVEVLNKADLVHLNIKPESVYVSMGADGPEFSITGLENATRMTTNEPLSHDVDLFHDPPESLSSPLMTSGAALAKWDWWSLGRIVQEVVLGRHVYDLVLKQVSRPLTEENRKNLRIFLSESPRGKISAGATELMTDASTSVLSLLRGLLTTAVSDRWGASEIRQWLQAQAGPTQDDKPVVEEPFSWKGRVMTIREAAEYFTLEENWKEGESQFFPEPEDSETLIHYLRRHQTRRGDAERIGAVLAIMDQPSWQEVPVTARRTALTAAAWVAAAGSDAHASLRLMGRGIDWQGLQATFRANPTGESAPLFHALIAPGYIALVEGLDAATAQSLKRLSGSVTDAFQTGYRTGFISREAMDEHVQIFALALESGMELENHVKRLRGRFASHKDAELAGILANPKPERWMLVLLAYIGEHPDGSGFITHADQNLETFRRLNGEAELVTTILFWKRLAQALNTGPLIFPPWWIFGLFWGVLGALVIKFSGDWMPVAGVVAAILGLRLLSHAFIRRQVRRHGRTAEYWRWTDHSVRCRREIERLKGSLSHPLEASPRARLEEIARRVSELQLQPPPNPPPAPPGVALLWSGSGISVLGALGLVASIAHPLLRNSAVDAAREIPAAAADGTHAAGPVAEAPAFFEPPPGSPPGLYEAFDDGFGRQLRGPLTTWDVPSTAVGEPLVLQSEVRADPEQVAYALIAGELLLKPYPSRGVSALLAVRVPAHGRVALMLYDGQTRRLASRDVFIVDSPPLPRTWHRLAGRNVVYLGVPDSLAAELGAGERRH